MRVALAMGVANQFQTVLGDNQAFVTSLPSRLRARYQGQMTAPDPITPDEYLDLYATLRADVIHDYPRARLFFGPAATLWLTDAFWQAIGRKAEEYETGVHIHMDESHYERLATPRVKGMSSVLYLRQMGVLNARTSLPHAVWVTEADLTVLAESGASIVHNPSSNLRLRCGIAPVNALRAAGINVALGIDSTGINDDDDMLQEMGLCALLHRTPGLGTPCPDHYDVLAMATIHGAQAALLGDEIGTLEAGKRADITVVDLRRARVPYTDPSQDPVALLVGRVRARDVSATLVNGEVIVRNGRHTRIDIDEVLERQRDYFRRVGTRDPEKAALLQEVTPYIVDYYRKRFDQSGNRAQPYYLFNSRRWMDSKTGD